MTRGIYDRSVVQRQLSVNCHYCEKTMPVTKDRRKKSRCGFHFCDTDCYTEWRKSSEGIEIMERLIDEGKTKTAGRPKGAFKVEFDQLEFERMVLHEFPRLRMLAEKFNLKQCTVQYHRNQILQKHDIDATSYNLIVEKKDPRGPTALIISEENSESKEFYQRNIVLNFWNYDKDRWDVCGGLWKLANLRKCSVSRVKKEIEFHKLSSYIKKPYTNAIPPGLNMKRNGGSRLPNGGRSGIRYTKLGLLRPIKLERININAKGSSRFYWKCQCDCGNECIKTADYLLHHSSRKTKVVQSCGCEDKRVSRWKKLNIDAKHFNRIKSSAKKRNLEFNITPEFLHELFYKQNQKSAITGVPLVLPKYEGRGTGLSNNPSENDDYIASLDRIDSNKGYTEDNVWWIGRRENICKSSLSMADLEDFFKNGYENLKRCKSLQRLIEEGVL